MPLLHCYSSCSVNCLLIVTLSKTNRSRRRSWTPHHTHVVLPGLSPGTPTKISIWIPNCFCHTSFKLNIVVIYCPPSPLHDILDEMDSLLSCSLDDGTPLVVLGDFNIPTQRSCAHLNSSTYSPHLTLALLTLTCFTSYLTNHTFQVTWNGSLSKLCFLETGVPQGSVLGPVPLRLDH